MREMKNSGVEWIGEIPSEWDTSTIGAVYRVRNEKVNDTDYPPLSVTKGGIVPQMDSVAKSDANDNRKQVLKGDFVINSRSDRKQSCGVSPLDGSVSLINTVIYPNRKANIVPEFANYLLKNYGFAEEFYRWGHGIVADLWTTRWQEMQSIAIPMTTEEEQKLIVEALDTSIDQVDSLISNQEQQIEKLKAYKQSLITEVVTKGLDRSVPMKDSGVEWIGEIPQRWKVKRTKFVADSLSKGNGITKEEVVEDGDIQCVRYGEIYSKYDGAFTESVSRTCCEKLSSPQFISKGNILFAGTGELVEEIGKNVVYMGDEPCLAGGDIVIMTHSENPVFLNYALNSISSQMQKSKGKAKLKVVHISASNIGDVLLAIPPIKEQEEIARFLDGKCLSIKSLIAIKQSKIEKLKAYKQSLIYEYVTGKKEV